MKPLSLLGFCLALSFTASTAQVVQWHLERHPSIAKVDRRSDESTFEEVITNEKGKGGYFATVRIGNPGQDLVLQLDTASSDSWVPYSGAPICEAISVGCKLGSCQYRNLVLRTWANDSPVDPLDSETFKEVAEDRFEISYIDSSYAHGDYFEDSFEIGGAKVHNLTMGLGMQTDIPYGLVGVGYATNEASLSTVGQAYPNLPIAMEEEGLINSIAYSLWLNDLGANTGNILFGGVDTGKYVGTMIKIEVIPDDHTDNYTHFIVSLTSLEATSPTGTDVLASHEEQVEVVLDSGTTLSYLPNDMAAKVWEEVGAEYQSAFGMAVLPCSHAIHPGYFSFGFAGPAGPRINVTMDELVVDLTDGDQPRFTSGPYDGELVCEFGIQNYSTGPFVLGDTFLRSAYVVYDLENHEIGIAATDFNSTNSHIIAFESKGAPIPLATNSDGDNGITDSAVPTSTSLVAADGFQDSDKTDGTPCATGPSLSSQILALYCVTLAVLVSGME